MRYVKSKFMEEYEPTIEDVYSKQSVIDKEACVLHIIDTCGEAHCSSPVLEGQIRGGDGYLCMFSLDNSHSFLRTPGQDPSGGFVCTRGGQTAFAEEALLMSTTPQGWRV